MWHEKYTRWNYNRLYTAGRKSREVQEIPIESTENETQGEVNLKILTEGLDLWHNFKWPNIHVIGKVFEEVMVKFFLNLMKTIKP